MLTPSTIAPPNFPGTCGRALKTNAWLRLLACLPFLLYSLAPLLAQNQTGERQKLRINLDWRFHKGDVQGDPTTLDFDDSGWQAVAVPHAPELVSLEMDSTLDGRPQLTYLRDVSWYRKRMDFPNTPGQRFFLEFEGVHQVTDLWVNGEHVGQYAVGGYTPFHFDVTDFVKPGAENLVVVKADNSANEHTPPDPHKTDYVKFGGMYRDVYLVVTNPLHVTFNWEAFDAGVHITTPSVRKHDATVSVKTTVRNDNDNATMARIVTRIINAEGLVIHAMEARTQVQSGAEHTFRQTTAITDNLHLWSPENPYLYRVHSTIYEGESPVDFVENTLGVRWFELVDGKKFVLNGEPLWLVGVNRHQNFPIIGDATPDALGVAEAELYKAAGMNCIRLSHYTQDESFIAACDRLGILVYEEAPTWIDWGRYLEQTKHIEYSGRSIYAAMVNAVDAGVGRIDSTLVANGIKDNTMIVFLSDNGGRGQWADNRPGRGFKGMLFEGGIKVPFFINWPAAIAGGSVYDHMITSLDIYPTVLEAAGADAGAMTQLDGKDLLPFVNGRNESPPHYQLFWRSVGGYEYAVRKGDYKLYKNASKEKTMLFNLAEDPGERQDLAITNPEMVAQLETTYRTWDADNMEPGWLDPHIENCIRDERVWRKDRNKSLRPTSLGMGIK